MDSLATSKISSPGREHKLVAPENVKSEAEKKEKENMAFRTFLKGHADERILDQQFAELHEALFANYECDRCRNCCKLYHGAIPQEEIEKDAACLGISQERFMDQYLQKELTEERYLTKRKPCDFLEPNGSCKLGGDTSRKAVRIIHTRTKSSHQSHQNRLMPFRR